MKPVFTLFFPRRQMLNRIDWKLNLFRVNCRLSERRWEWGENNARQLPIRNSAYASPLLDWILYCKLQTKSIAQGTSQLYDTLGSIACNFPWTHKKESHFRGFTVHGKCSPWLLKNLIHYLCLVTKGMCMSLSLFFLCFSLHRWFLSSL
jgi:hypothetical protein